MLTVERLEDVLWLGAFREPVYLPTTGTYTVIVDPPYNYTATVSVTAYLVADDVVGTLTTNGSTVPVTLTTVGQKAGLTFAASAGQQVTVRLTNNTMGQTTVRLLKPNGNLQTYRTSSSSSFNLTTQTLSTAGTYTVEVDPNDTNLGGISMQVTSP